MKKREKNDRKKASVKHKKGGSLVILLLAAICVCGVLIFLVAKYVSDLFYPHDVLDDATVLINTVPVKDFVPLNEAARVMEEQYGESIYAYDGYERYAKEPEDGVYAVIWYDSYDNSRIVVAKGSGDVQKDIHQYASSFYDSLGSVEGDYTEKIFEEGNLYGYSAQYSCGRMEMSNLFSQKPLYVAGISYTVADGSYMTFMFSTNSVGKLREHIDMLTLFSKITYIDGLNNAFLPDGEEDVMERAPIVMDENNSDISNRGDAATEGTEQAATVDTSVGYSEDVIKFAEAWKQTRNPEPAGSAFFVTQGNISTAESPVSVSQKSMLGYGMFRLNYKEGNPLHVLLYNPSMDTYYEPDMVDTAGKTYYFFVKEPEIGIWHAVIQLDGVIHDDTMPLTYYLPMSEDDIKQQQGLIEQLDISVPETEEGIVLDLEE